VAVSRILPAVTCLLSGLLAGAPQAAELLGTAGEVPSERDGLTPENMPEVNNAATVWDRFLASADAESVATALDALSRLLDENGEADRQRCREGSSDQLNALVTAPVSLSAWHLVRLCAETEGDEEVAERATLAFAELSRLALSYNPAVGSDASPIRILSAPDIYLLAGALDHEVLYVDYVLLEVKRHLPIEAALWDPSVGRELVLRFDFLDTWTQIGLNQDRTVSPEARRHFARQALGHAAKESPTMPAAVALNRMQTILGKEGEDSLRAAVLLASAGDIGAARGLANLCLLDADRGCGDLAVDAILPFAEQQWALPSVWLAIAYAKGRGVARDGRAAERLLDLADRRLGEHRGTLAAGMQLLSRQGADPLPDVIRKRLKRLAREGVGRAGHLLLFDESLSWRRPSARDRDRLAAAAEGGWAPLQVAAAEVFGEDEPERALGWLRAAATQGNALHQEILAQRLESRTADAAAAEEALSWRFAAAHGGSGVSALAVARRFLEEGRLRPAQQWFFSAAAGGEAEGAYEAALMFAGGGEGVHESHAAAIQLLRDTPNLASHVPSRRLLADLLMFGDDVSLRDPPAAADLLRKNVEEGDPESTTMLAEWLIQGRIDPKPGEDGERMLQLAVERGDVDSMTLLGMSIHSGSIATGDAEHALDLLARAAEKGSLIALNNLAWIRCTAVDPAYHDPAKGLVHARALALGRELPVSQRDTVAACHAANGDFVTAIDIQKTLLAELEAEGRDAEETRHFREALALYEQSQPFREDLRRSGQQDAVIEP